MLHIYVHFCLAIYHVGSIPSERPSPLIDLILTDAVYAVLCDGALKGLRDALMSKSKDPTRKRCYNDRATRTAVSMIRVGLLQCRLNSSLDPNPLFHMCQRNTPLKDPVKSSGQPHMHSMTGTD